MTRRLTRRQFALLSCAAVPLLAGCRGSTSGATGVTMQVSLPLNAYERTFFKQSVLPPFERQHRLQVELVGGNPSEVSDQLRAGQGRLDLAAADLETLGVLIAQGLVQDVSAARKQLEGDVIPSLIPGLESAGTLYALPLHPAVWVTFYNSALLGTAGLAPPTTWDDLLAVAEALHGLGAPGGVALQGAADGPAAQSLIELIWAFGGDPLAPDGDGALAAARFLQRLAPSLAPLSREARIGLLTEALGNDRVALGPNWSFVAADLLQRGGKREIGAYAGPVGPAGRARLVSGRVLAVPTGAPNHRLALELAAHLRSRPIQELLVSRLAWTPVRDDVAGAAPAWQRPVAEATREALLTARALPPLRGRGAIAEALGDAFRQVAFAGAPPREALDRAAARLRALK